MNRLTEADEQYCVVLKGISWRSLYTLGFETFHRIYYAVLKLKEYEDSGLSPDEVQAMIELHDTRKPERIQMPQEVVDHIMQRFTDCK